MSPYVAKLAPVTVVLATAVYCTMSGLKGSGSKAEVKPPAKRPEFTSALLSPNFPPPSKRDPFQRPGEAPRETAKSRIRGAKAAGAKAAGAKAAGANDAQLILNATCIVGNQRLAVINGQVYQQRDTIGTSNAAVPQYVIAEILPRQVVLECQGKRLQLRYSDSAAEQGKGPTRPASLAGASRKSNAMSAPAASPPRANNKVENPAK